MGLKQLQPAQKRQKKNTCVTNEEVPPSGLEVVWILRQKSRRPLHGPAWMQLSILLSEGLNKFECCGKNVFLF